jgi:hypothetical protein
LINAFVKSDDAQNTVSVLSTSTYRLAGDVTYYSTASLQLIWNLSSGDTFTASYSSNGPSASGAALAPVGSQHGFNLRIVDANGLLFTANPGFSLFKDTENPSEMSTCWTIGTLTGTTDSCSDTKTSTTVTEGLSLSGFVIF